MPRQMLTGEFWLKLKAIMFETGIYNKPMSVPLQIKDAGKAL